MPWVEGPWNLDQVSCLKIESDVLDDFIYWWPGSLEWCVDINQGKY
jgi:hypothetical protein